MSDALSDEPVIATYRERWDGLRREFTLYADRVTIHAWQLTGKEFTHHILLAELSPHIGLVRFRSVFFRAGAMLCAAFAFFLWVFLWIFQLPWTYARVPITAALCVVSFACAAFYYRRYTAYRFTSRSGIVVLDCVEAGPEKHHCRAFAEIISQAIRDATAVVKKSDPPS